MGGTSVMGALKHAYNVFRNREPTESSKSWFHGGGSSRPIHDYYTSYLSESSVVTSIYNRMAIDISSIDLKHVRLDENDRYVDTIDSGLHKLFNLEANIDQTGRAFVRDIVISMFQEGDVAIVPITTKLRPKDGGSIDILEARVGRITQYYPRHVTVDVYNEETGEHEEITLPKRRVAIISNPMFEVMNLPNSTLQRLIRKIDLLDAIDEQSGSGKLDIIIQLPYQLKGEKKKDLAAERLKEIEMQLSGSKYGVAYIDGLEKVTQLNRPAENNLLEQIKYLTDMLYVELGLTKNVIDGTADETEMLNYYNRTVEPCLDAICGEVRRKWLTQTSRTQRQSFIYLRDPFKLVPIGEIAEIADTFTRNEVFSSNDVRGIVGWRPSKDPNAEELRNKNINQKEDASQEVPVVKKTAKEKRLERAKLKEVTKGA